MKVFVLCLLVVISSAMLPAQNREQLAATPPMGWNSWDGFATNINEAQSRANADWLAKHLKPFGWEYVVIDMEWFASPPGEDKSAKPQLNLDQFGRYIPSVEKFPSAANGAGFKPLAAYVHSLGLKFGIHIVRGIPREAEQRNLPIANSSHHAKDAADTTETCPWNADNYGLDSSRAGGQDYYDSIANLYASWEVDFVKVDCISSHPYRGDEIRMLSQAITKTGRPIVLSLSPGPAPLEKLDEVRQYAQMWRISDDVWDLWHSSTAFPQGLGDQFAKMAAWAGKSQPGRWPDADMLPFGRLGPTPGWGQPRDSQLSRDEQRSFMTLWCIFPSPLMVGGDLTSADDWTLALLTNPEILEVDQHSTGNHPVATDNANAVVWISESASGKGHYVALFNIGEKPAKFEYPWQKLGLKAGRHKARDLWQRKDFGTVTSLTVELPAHASVLYRVE